MVNKQIKFLSFILSTEDVKPLVNLKLWDKPSGTSKGGAYQAPSMFPSSGKFHMQIQNPKGYLIINKLKHSKVA